MYMGQELFEYCKGLLPEASRQGFDDKKQEFMARVKIVVREHLYDRFGYKTPEDIERMMEGRFLNDDEKTAYEATVRTLFRLDFEDLDFSGSSEERQTPDFKKVKQKAYH